MVRIARRPRFTESIAPPMRWEHPLRFVAWTFLLASPTWLLGAVVDEEILPGLPVSALAAFAPLLAAIVVARQEHGRAGVRQLLSGASDLRRVRSRAWLVLTLLLMPAIMAASYLVMIALGQDLPAPTFNPIEAILLIVLFYIPALTEELGWTGYATAALTAKRPPLNAALLVGSVWVVFHLIALAQAGRSLSWIVGWSLGTLAIRVIMGFLYDSAGRSVVLAALFHMSINATWQLFPVQGSYYNPWITSLIECVIAVVIVTRLWPTARVRPMHAD